MQIKFDQNKLEFKRIRLKSINATQGYLTYLDEEITDKEKYIKLSCNGTLMRAYYNTYRISNYQIPQEACIAIYDGSVISIEKSIINERYTESLDGTLKLWSPQIIGLFDKIAEIATGDWYIDGSYLYQFTGEEHPLTSDNKFSSRFVRAIQLTYLGFIAEVNVETRHCLKYTSNVGSSVTTPPIWKSLIGQSSIKTDNDELASLTRFEKIDETKLVNLQFAISCGYQLSKQFGYHIIEPLQLPKMMVQLKTVNLISLSSELKQTFDIGTPFTFVMSWLMGLSRNIRTFDDMLVLRRVMRSLTTNGLYHRAKLKQLVAEVPEIPLLTPEQAYDQAIARNQ